MPVKSRNTTEDRIAISARVSKEAALGWKHFCNVNGISLAAFIEAAGLELAKETFPPNVSARRRMVEAARRVDLERRSREPKSET